MRWEDERYVRWYTRDTADWLSLSLEAQGLMGLILRKVDRAGIMPLGRHGERAVAIALGHALRWETVAPALNELLADGCIRIEGECLLIPNFIEAQEAAQSDAQRQRESRAKARALASMAVTKRDELSQPVTDGHTLSQPVTPSRAVLSLLNLSENPADAGISGMKAPNSLNQLATDRRKKTKDERPTNPRHAVMVKRLSAIFLELRGSEYSWSDKRNFSALSGLLNTPGATDEEIETRWRRGLTAPANFREHCDTVADLNSNWNRLTGGAQINPTQARKYDEPTPKRLF